MDAIRVTGLTRCFGSRKAVDGLDLVIGEGELFALLGQNGAGKTTTIRMLCGLLTPDSGRAELMGKDVVADTQAVKQIINVSPQETAVASKLTVRENLEFVAEVYGSKGTEAKEKAARMMEDFDLADRANDRAKSLSGGMQRRLSIAMALISEPDILFLDEPTLGLDVRARRELWKHIEQLKGKMTIILTTHYLEEAESLADRIGIMSKGSLIALGTADEIKTQTGKETLEDAFLELTDGEEAEK